MEPPFSLINPGTELRSILLKSLQFHLTQVFHFLLLSSPLTSSSYSLLVQWVMGNYEITNVFKVGDYIGVRGSFTQFHFTTNCANMSYIDVTLLSCGGYAFFSAGGYGMFLFILICCSSSSSSSSFNLSIGNHTYKRVKVTYGPPPVAGMLRCPLNSLYPSPLLPPSLLY